MRGIDLRWGSGSAKSSKLIREPFNLKMDSESKYRAKAAQEFLKVKKCEIPQWLRQSPDMFLVIKYKNGGRKTHKEQQKEQQ